MKLRDVSILNQQQKVKLSRKIAGKINDFFFHILLEFFMREGERFAREDPLVPLSNSILTDITQNRDQSWTSDQEPDNLACSTTTFFMAKSSTPEEMINALMSGKNLFSKKNFIFVDNRCFS